MKKSVKQLTLKKVRSAFNQWRSNKDGVRIPQRLWDQVNALRQFYKPNLIRKTLSISGSQYKKYVLGQKSDAIFVEVPIKPQPIRNIVLKTKLPTRKLVEVDILRGDGSRLSIKQLDARGVSHLIQVFLG